MTGRLRTAAYPAEARERLGRAVAEAREAAGYRSRPAFVAAADGVNAKSLELLERGEPGVGPLVLNAVADALPGWTRDTPRTILEGGDPPSPAGQAGPLQEAGERTLADLKRDIIASDALTEDEKLAMLEKIFDAERRTKDAPHSATGEIRIAQ
jgi:hypothetical protein